MTRVRCGCATSSVVAVQSGIGPVFLSRTQRKLKAPACCCRRQVHRVAGVEDITQLALGGHNEVEFVTHVTRAPSESLSHCPSKRRIPHSESVKKRRQRLSPTSNAVVSPFFPTNISLKFPIEPILHSGTSTTVSCVRLESHMRLICPSSELHIL